MLQSSGGHDVVVDGLQALPSCLQQYACFSALQPACQLLKPAAQSSNGTVVVAGGAVGHPLPPCAQHQARLPTDQCFSRHW